MAFNTYGVSENAGKKSDFDFDAFNRDVIAQADLTERAVLTGVVSAIVDLGTQNRADAELEFKGNSDEEAAEVAKNPNTYFKDGKNDKGEVVRLKCYPQRPIQCVVFAVDLPDVIVDKGKHFGESKPLPLRLYLGGQFYQQGVGMVVQRPTEMKIVKGDKGWSFDKKHLCHKMAVATKLIDPDGVFLPQDIDKLLGKSFQFEAQVFMKKSNGKEYYTEYLKFMGALPRGSKPAELPYEPSLVQFTTDNKDSDIKDLRAHVVNTIKRANNYEGSKIKEQIERVRGTTTASNPPASANVPAEPKPAPKVAVKGNEPPPSIDFDDDIPFNQYMKGKLAYAV